MRALIVVDVQNDFLPGGALPVPRGHEVVEVINALIPGFDVVVATQDWHPEDHGSFAVHHGRAPGELGELAGLPQILWPTHCVQGSAGAQFAPGLRSEAFDAVFRKGQDATVDSYSGFFDNARRRDTGLDSWLRSRGVQEVTLVGLATDYCVKFTALDASALGYEVRLVRAACRGVELSAGDVERALGALSEAGVRVV